MTSRIGTDSAGFRRRPDANFAGQEMQRGPYMDLQIDDPNEGCGPRLRDAISAEGGFSTKVEMNA